MPEARKSTEYSLVCGLRSKICAGHGGQPRTQAQTRSLSSNVACGAASGAAAATCGIAPTGSGAGCPTTGGGAGCPATCANATRGRLPHAASMAATSSTSPKRCCFHSAATRRFCKNSASRGSSVLSVWLPSAIMHSRSALTHASWSAVGRARAQSAAFRSRSTSERSHLASVPMNVALATSSSVMSLYPFCTPSACGHMHADVIRGLLGTWPSRNRTSTRRR